MARKNHAEHARVTAICVNLALDGVEDEIRSEIEHAHGETVQVLERVLEQIRRRRLAADEIKAVGTC